MEKSRKEFRISELCPAFSHYTDAVWCNGFLFVSGIVACDQSGKPVAKGDAVAQTEHIFSSLKLILDAAGLVPADILKVTIYATDISIRSAINPVRQRFFGEVRPASTLVEVSALVHPDLMVEVEAVAAKADM